MAGRRRRPLRNRCLIASSLGFGGKGTAEGRAAHPPLGYGAAEHRRAAVPGRTGEGIGRGGPAASPRGRATRGQPVYAAKIRVNSYGDCAMPLQVGESVPSGQPPLSRPTDQNAIRPTWLACA